MSSCTVDRIIEAQAMAEGAGVVVHRTIGTASLRNLDPFLMLDHFGSDNPNEYIAGFPDHPHRGFITVTYMLDGRMLHEDSMGNRGNLGAGDVQWMRAASGVIHSEMPQQSNGLMRGFQLWINLPASQKMSEPGYQEFSSKAIPIVTLRGGTVKVISGALVDDNRQSIIGPVKDTTTDVFYFDVDVNAAALVTFPVNKEHRIFAYCYEGSASVDQNELPTHSLSTFTPGSAITISAGKQGAKLILVGGKPINEEIVQYGPFVMNTREEIETAMADFHAGRLVRSKAAYVSDN